jgi:hypothetical protein
MSMVMSTRGAPKGETRRHIPGLGADTTERNPRVPYVRGGCTCSDCVRQSAVYIDAKTHMSHVDVMGPTQRIGLVLWA